MTRVVVAPPVLAFLPQYAGREDPVPEVRAAALAAVAWLGADVTVVADEQGRRVAEHLLASTARTGDEPSYLLMANGSARRTDESPGPYDERAVPFDDAVRAWLLEGSARPDLGLGEELWATTAPLERLDGLGRRGAAQVDYDEAPLGVQYWVVRWTCDS
ncbi:hypothetical protein G5V58_19415 [Nocardioides anomalus]|uniref:Uncharacterized protein n=1 Tax=Nocardioides anomalus TaxID=2712223 RepID=A0A6G6WH53_9ACTN|nr:hypothetical protein [Nocardioides anomalus]QIG44658.1 hypothetical protein G5V58_19415 [Nocardioides anomalus]